MEILAIEQFEMMVRGGDDQRLANLANLIGRNIRKVIDDKRVNRSQLAESLGVTENAITQILGGRSCKQYAKLRKLADKLGVTPTELIGGAKHDESLELFRGAVEGVLLGLGHPPAEADEVANIALLILDKPVTSGKPRDRARTLAEDLARQYADLKRK